MVVVVSATRTASVATLAASVAFLAISLMETLISSLPVATVWRLRLTCSPAAATTLAWLEVSSALALICWLVLESSSLELATTLRVVGHRLDEFAQIVLHFVHGRGDVAEFVPAGYLNILTG